VGRASRANFFLAGKPGNNENNERLALPSQREKVGEGYVSVGEEACGRGG
jgi:hypothetical protein